LDLSPDALVLVNEAGTIVMLNEQVEAFFGYSRQELLGQTLEVLLPERLRAVHVAHRQHYCRAPRMRPMGTGLQLVGQRKDATEVPVDITLRPLWLDEQLLMMGAIRDMTLLRRLEQAERAVHAQTVAQLAFLKQVLDALPSSVHLVYGPDGRLLLANRAARSLWGADWQVHQPMQEFLSTTSIALFDPEGRLLPASALATLRAVRQGETVLQLQETTGLFEVPESPERMQKEPF
jgi:PAS domain S-box-containing protein